MIFIFYLVNIKFKLLHKNNKTIYLRKKSIYELHMSITIVSSVIFWMIYTV